jgi:DnaD/phage-associated family protein
VNELQGGEMIPASLFDLEAQEAPATVQGSQQAIAAREYANSRGEISEARTVASNIQVEVERPNIFVLYEQNIGLLSPLIAEDLKDAADQYPAEWIEAAFREAVQHNKRKWTYIRAILRRWETEGRQTWNA